MLLSLLGFGFGVCELAGIHAKVTHGVRAKVTDDVTAPDVRVAPSVLGK